MRMFSLFLQGPSFLGRRMALFFCLLASLLLSLFLAGTALADHQTYSVTGGIPDTDNNDFPASGDAAVNLTAITITETDIVAGSFENNPETLEINIHELYTAVIFDPTLDENDLTVSGTCEYDVVQSATVSTNGRTITVLINDGGDGANTDCDQNENIILEGLRIQTITGQSAPGAVGVIRVRNPTNAFAPGLVGNVQGSAISRSVSIADATATIALDTPTVGQESGASVSLTLPRDLQVGEHVRFTVPDNLDISNVSFLEHDFGGDGTFDCSLDGQVLTCTVIDNTVGDGDGSTTGSLEFDDIVPLYVLEGVIINNFTVFFDLTGDIEAQFASDSSVAITDTEAASLTASSLSLSPPKRGVSSMAILSFTNPGSVDIANNDKIVIVFPDGFDVDGAEGSCDTMDGTVATGVVDQTVTLTRGGGASAQAPAAEICTITGIVNPVNPGNTGTFDFFISTNGNSVRYTITLDGTAVIGGGGGGGIGGSGGTGGTVETDGTSGNSGAGDTDESGSVSMVDNEGSDSEKDNSSENDESANGHSTEEEEDENTSSLGERLGGADIPFEDVPVTHWALEYIETLFDMGVVQGRSETVFAPDEELTRAEIVKIALLTFGYEVSSEVTSDAYSDVNDGDWFVSYVAVADEAGIVEGYGDGTFRPNALVTRAEALKILLLASGLNIQSSAESPFEDVDQAAWYAPYVNYAYALGIVRGKADTLFAPDDNITRAEMSKIAVKAYGLDR